MTNSVFPMALAFTLGQEGGKADNKRDPGGRTNAGITQRTYDAWRRLRGLPKKDVFLLTSAEIRAFYGDLWYQIGCDKLDPGTAVMALDIGTNMGIGRVKPWLAQTASLAPVARIKKLDALRCGFWRSLRIFRFFGNVWLRRETACLKLALQLTK